MAIRVMRDSSGVWHDYQKCKVFYGNAGLIISNAWKNNIIFIKGDAREVRLVVHTGGEENRAIIIVKLPYLVHICVYLQVTLNTDKTAIKRSSNSFAAILYRW